MGVASCETNKLSTTRVDAAVDVSRDGSAILPASTRWSNQCDHPVQDPLVHPSGSFCCYRGSPGAADTLVCPQSAGETPPIATARASSQPAISWRRASLFVTISSEHRHLFTSVRDLPIRSPRVVPPLNSQSMYSYALGFIEHWAGGGRLL